MRSYAQWLAGDPSAELSFPGRQGFRHRYPTNAERLAKASFYAKREVSKPALLALEYRADFREYFGKLREDGQYYAGELARDRIRKNFEYRDKALDAAAGVVVLPDGRTIHGEMDLELVERYTRPYLDHGMPKKVEKEVAAPRIVIHLSGVDPKALLAPAGEIEDVEFEVVENPKLLEAGDDDTL
jgi:hypothetical protein